MRRLLVVVLLLCLPMVGEGQSIRYYPSSSSGSNDWDVTSPVIWDDFCGGINSGGSIGTMNWQVGAVTPSYTLVTGRPCVMTLTAAASATGGIYTPYAFAAYLADIDSIEAFVAWGTGANQPDSRFGTIGGSIAGAPAASAIYFERLAADTNWFAVTRDGAAANQTRTDTGVAFSANTYYRLGIKHPSTGRWDFYINTALVASRTTGNIPAEASQFLPMVQITTNGTSLAAYFDYFFMRLRAVR